MIPPREMTRWFTQKSAACSLRISMGACVSDIRARQLSKRSAGASSALRNVLSGSMITGLHRPWRPAQHERGPGARVAGRLSVKTPCTPGQCAVLPGLAEWAPEGR
ncbi:hypothetical protein GCM10020254_81560 [Streptomyces goshikiensis]